MAYTIDKVGVFSGSIKDKPGGLAVKLDALAEAGADLEFVLARRDKPGKGILFVAPITGAKQGRAAKKAGLSKKAGLQALRVAGTDKPGLGAKLTAALGEAGISMRGLSAVRMGRKCVVYIALDSKKDVAKAQRILSKALSVK